MGRRFDPRETALFEFEEKKQRAKQFRKVVRKAAREDVMKELAPRKAINFKKRFKIFKPSKKRLKFRGRARKESFRNIN